MPLLAEKRGAHSSLKAGDAVWVAVALLHREHPKRQAFSVREIEERVKKEGLTETDDRTVYQHANQHCVANRPPNPAKLRMLYETHDGLRRLYSAGDPFHPERDGRSTPRPEDLPERLRPLLDWYEHWSDKRRERAAVEDPLLRLAGSGRGMWDKDAVAYINRLREE